MNLTKFSEGDFLRYFNCDHERKLHFNCCEADGPYTVASEEQRLPLVVSWGRFEGAVSVRAKIGEDPPLTVRTGGALEGYARNRTRR